MRIPVRVPADLQPVLASRRRFDLADGHPLYSRKCAVCSQPLGERTIVVVFTGIAPEDRQESGHTTGQGVAVHEDCAGVPGEVLPETG